MSRGAHGALETTLLSLLSDVKRRHGRGPYVVRLEFPGDVDGGGFVIACRLMSWSARLAWWLCRVPARLWA